jgi:hypothetical protein
MYLLLLLLFPLLYLFNPYLAMGGLIAGIVGMYFQRTQAAKRPHRNGRPNRITRPATNN